MNPAKKLHDLKPEKQFFIGLDSDGCVFDTMEIKHKECFCPNFIEKFGLQSVSRYSREVWDFVNLYSKMRGCNRFLAVIGAIDLLKRKPEVVKRGAKIPELSALRDWIKRETQLGNPALVKEMETNKAPEFDTIYDFSISVNKTIERMVHGIPPFPFVRECLDKVQDKADMIVVSQTPFAALNREWKEHGIDKFVKVIAGQEMGTKTEHLEFAAVGKYPLDQILMVGDAPGDLKAAKTNGVLFYPVNPGNEDASWERLFNEGLDKFFDKSYAGTYENKLIEEFQTYLPERPPWEA
ncbi:MAG: HAD family hydrolase [Spirochaetales bacterium]|nr:HAD family hydrolase [Spirochaetales bacterium]